MEDSYIVKNMTETDINLGEIRGKVLLGQTVDLMRTIPGITIEKLMEQEKNRKSTLSVTLEKRMLVKIKPKNSSAERMKVIGRPAVFVEEAENITFPNKVQKGIVMEENSSLLEKEILRDDEEDDKKLTPTAQEGDDIGEAELTKSVVMSEVTPPVRNPAEQNADVTRMEVVADNGSLSILPTDQDEVEAAIRGIKSLAEDYTPAPSYESKVVSENGAFAVVPKDDAPDEHQARSLTIKTSENQGLASVPQTQLQKAAGKKPNDIMKDSTVEPRMENGAVTAVDLAESPGRCQAQTRHGKQCRNKAKESTKYCKIHKMQE